jgi:hypothetical protein
VWSPKKFTCQKASSVLACFQTSAAPRPENSDSDKEDALFGLDTEITISEVFFRFVDLKKIFRRNDEKLKQKEIEFSQDQNEMRRIFKEDFRIVMQKSIKY